MIDEEKSDFRNPACVIHMFYANMKCEKTDSFYLIWRGAKAND